MSTKAALAAAKLFTPKDTDLLKRHLQALVAVEFLTIPLYLTAVYSFTEQALAYRRADNSAPLYDAQQEVLSVAVQEMLHLQLAANLCNAFGVTPEIPKLVAHPGEVIVVPHLEPTPGTPFTTTIGNLPAVMDALIAIETPDPDDGGGFPGPNDKVTYKSIADLYHATLYLLQKYVAAYAMVTTADDPTFIPNHLQVNYATFATTYSKIPVIAKRSDVATVANAVTDQGEGGLVARAAGGMFKSGDGDVLPEFRPADGTRFARWGAKTHYQRFVDVKAVIDSKEFVNRIGVWFYASDGTKSADLPSWAPSADDLQKYSSTIWSYLVDAMQAGFGDGTLNPSTTPSGPGPGFNDAMLAFKYITPLLWQSGQVIGYVYAPGATGAQAQAAMDGAAPLSLFHWDAKTDALRQQWAADHVALNACQGLNECKGKGWGGVGTQPGDGACATADLHTCGGGNDCSAQGGCAFLSYDGKAILDPDQQWIPDANVGPKSGGCQTPISTRQVFDRSAANTIDQQTGAAWTDAAKQSLTDLMGKNVWERARELFAARHSIATLPTPQSTAPYDSNARRAALAPTSV